MKNKKVISKNFPLVSIAITNWNGKNFCLDCLKSISKLNYPHEMFEVIVIDNASTDGSIEAIRRGYPSVRILEQKKNLGFAAAMNIGLKNAKGKYTLALNNDVILDKDCLMELVRVAESDSKIGIAGAKVYSMDNPNEIQCVLGRLERRTMHLKVAGGGEVDRGQYEKVTEADWVPFLCLIRNRALKKVGYLEERYFHTFEDTDIMIRLQDAGFRLVSVPKTKIWHKGAGAFGKDTSQLIYYLQRNNLLIRKKFNGYTSLDHIRNLRFLCSLCVTYLFTKRKKEHKAAIRGILDFLRGRFGQRDI